MPSTSGKLKSRAKTTIGPTISIAEAKANFSSLLANVEKKRSPVTILKRGMAVAQLIPLSDKPATLFGSMRGTARELGDIVGPTGVEWTLKEEDE